MATHNDSNRTPNARNRATGYRTARAVKHGAASVTRSGRPRTPGTR